MGSGLSIKKALEQSLPKVPPLEKKAIDGTELKSATLGAYPKDFPYPAMETKWKVPVAHLAFAEEVLEKEALRWQKELGIVDVYLTVGEDRYQVDPHTLNCTLLS